MRERAIPMSLEPEAENSGGPPVTSPSLDLTGIPVPVADELRKLVATLRENLGRAPSAQDTSVEETPEDWSRRLQAWVDTHPARPIQIDDDRVSLYAGRGE